MRQTIDDRPYIEFLAGRAVPKVTPQRRHGFLQITIGMLLRRLAGNRGDVGSEWRFYMNAPGEPRTSLVPDVAFVSRERLDELPPELREKTPLSPDIAVEIRSPDDRVDDVEWKMRAYLSMGGTLALDVLPDTHEVRSFTRDGMRVFSNGDRFESDAVPWLAFDVSGVFDGLGE
jgi:Uma2 family endonuclease